MSSNSFSICSSDSSTGPGGWPSESDSSSSLQTSWGSEVVLVIGGGGGSELAVAG